MRSPFSDFHIRFPSLAEILLENVDGLNHRIGSIRKTLEDLECRMVYDDHRLRRHGIPRWKNKGTRSAQATLFVETAEGSVIPTPFLYPNAA